CRVTILVAVWARLNNKVDEIASGQGKDMANKGCTPAVMNIRVIDRNPVSHNVSAKTIVAVYMIRSEVGAERNQHRSPG
ncbi:MAG: hypothetical protein DMF26_07885, partial [Verrucomicrobia bacterium]